MDKSLRTLFNFVWNLAYSSNDRHEIIQRRNSDTTIMLGLFFDHLINREVPSWRFLPRTKINWWRYLLLRCSTVMWWDNIPFCGRSFNKADHLTCNELLYELFICFISHNLLLISSGHYKNCRIDENLLSTFHPSIVSFPFLSFVTNNLWWFVLLLHKCFHRIVKVLYYLLLYLNQHFYLLQSVPYLKQAPLIPLTDYFIDCSLIDLNPFIYIEQ